MSPSSTDLPLFERHKVNVARLKVNGIAGSPGRALKIDETVYFVVEAKTYAIEHTEGKDGVERLHKATIVRYGEMDAGEAQAILEALSERQRQAYEEEHGIIPMFGGADRAANDADE